MDKYLFSGCDPSVPLFIRSYIRHSLGLASLVKLFAKLLRPAEMTGPSYRDEERNAWKTDSYDQPE